jgi:hypothetical protein
MEYKMFKQKPSVINVGVRPFAEGVRDQGAETAHIAWKPPVDAKLSRMMRKMTADAERKEKIELANTEALKRLNEGEGYWIGIEKALTAIPGFKENMIMHSGPPIKWDDMLPVQRRGIRFGAVHAKLAKTPEEAEGMIRGGEIELASCNDYFVVGAAAGIVTANMVVNICEDRKTGLRGWCIPFEGRNGLGAWGNYDPEIERNLLEIEDFFAPAVDHVLKENGGINIRNIIAQGMQMGDECHTKQTACGMMLVSQIVPMLLNNQSLDQKTVARVTEMFIGNERWFHPLGMSSSMAVIRSIKGLPYCTLVTAIAQNGIETGIKVAALGERWFLAPAPRFTGQYFSTQWGPEDAVPYMGDSTVTEAMGMGGFAAAAAPNVLRLRGGGYREAIAQSEEMRLITYGRNQNFPIPLLDWTGPGLGIDIRKVIETGIAPLCHGGIVNKEGGQIGAGAARFPVEHYVQAMYAFIEQYKLF